MTETKRITETHYTMERGHELLEEGKTRAALLHFMNLAKEESDTEQRIRALQMSGVCLRLIGQYENAVSYLKRAKELLSSTSHHTRLRAAVHRDLGAALNKLGLVQKSPEVLREAMDEYRKSAEILKASLQESNLTSQDCKVLLAEKATTQGSRGLLLFEMGVKSTGIREIEQADTTLFNLDQNFEVYQLNNLVRLMRVSTILQRWHLLDLALKLTSKGSRSSGSRKRVWLAMLGNRLYRRFE